MPRGSSKEEGPGHLSESLPLSASPTPPLIRIVLEIRRGGRGEVRELDLPAGAEVREALRRIGQAPEGSAVWEGEEPIPLDARVVPNARYLVVPTFSGG